MTDFYARVRNTPSPSSDGNAVQVHSTPYGDLFTAEFFLSLAQRGRIMGVHFGEVTSPIATPATTAITAQRPQAWVRVPDGTSIIPISTNIVVESCGGTTQGEIAIAVDQNDVGNGTSSAATQGPTSLNAANPVTSLCTARQLATGDVTAATNEVEVKRFSFAASAVNQQFDHNHLNTQEYLLLTGPATYAIYVGGNAVNFFAQVKFAEVPTTALPTGS